MQDKYKINIHKTYKSQLSYFTEILSAYIWLKFVTSDSESYVAIIRHAKNDKTKQKVFLKYR